MSILQALQQIIALFRTNKDDSKAKIDAAFTDHAAAVQEADRACQVARGEADARLWELIRNNLDQRGADADEVSKKAGEFEDYAVMSTQEANRAAQELLDSKAKLDEVMTAAASRINPPPDPPKADAQVEIEETTTVP